MLRSCLAFAATLAIAACSSGVGEVFDTRQNAGPCPPAASIYDAARIVVLDGDGELFRNIRYTGEITGVRFQCRYADEDPIRGELEIDFAFGRGPAGEAETHTYPFFVTITRRDATVLARQEFDLTADFDGGSIDAITETLRDITIPRIDASISGANFEIIVGFVLTDAELQFNREGKRFRLDAQVGTTRP
ncbi:MAG: hypothetical protein AAF253_10800 [Pseudomonadota bacterium]